MNLIQTLLKDRQKKNIPDLKAGQVVRVHERISEGDASAPRETSQPSPSSGGQAGQAGSQPSPSSGGQAGQATGRNQTFEGLVIAVKHGRGLDGTFTVRKIGAGGVGVERIFPLHMPAIEKIEILRQEHVRRSKLYYIREQVDKKTKKRKAKIQNLLFSIDGEKEEEVEEELEDMQDVSEDREITEQENNNKGTKDESSVEGKEKEISTEQQKVGSTDEVEKK